MLAIDDGLGEDAHALLGRAGEQLQELGRDIGIPGGAGGGIVFVLDNEQAHSDLESGVTGERARIPA